MKVAGIICECDPPHAGHSYLIEQVRRDCDAVVCLMSGAFVQRADAAILSPRVRAEMLLSIGADAVLELPFPYCASGAESFADAGVSILDRLGADELWFGSECGDLSLLSKLADASRSRAFRSLYAERNRSTVGGTAALYRETLATFCGCETPLQSNDLLGISYLRAIGEQRASIRPATVRRIGSYTDGELPPDGGFASATALRRQILQGRAEAAYPYLPERVRELLAAEIAAGRAPVSLENAAQVVLTFLRLADPERIDRCAEASGGVGRRLQNLAGRATSLSELFALAATKKYPDARLRRAALFSLLDLTREDLRTPPAYVVPLALNRTGTAFLASVRKSSRIPVVLTRGDLPRTEAAARQRDLSERADALYACCFPEPCSPADLVRRAPLLR